MADLPEKNPPDKEIGKGESALEETNESESSDEDWPETEEESSVEWPVNPADQESLEWRLRRRYQESVRKWLDLEVQRTNQVVDPRTLLQARYEVERARINFEFFQEYCNDTNEDREQYSVYQF